MEILISALLLGLVGELHCVGMCGPIMLILPVDRETPWKKHIQLIIYHTGRLLAYASIGLLAGFLGKGLQLAGLQQKISLIFGLLMILVAFYPQLKFFKASAPSFWTRTLNFLKQKMNLYLKKRSFSSFFIMGFLNGYLPCGLVYMALVGALATGDPFKGALFMIFFGLGTTPAMMLITYLQNILTANLRNKIQKIIPYAVALVGILFVLRGLGLNIMYVSPGKKHLQVTPMKEKMYRKKIKKARGLFHKPQIITQDTTR